MALDCTGKKLSVGDEVTAQRNHDGIPVSSAGVVTRIQKNGKVVVDFWIPGVPGVRAVLGSILRKKLP